MGLQYAIRQIDRLVYVWAEGGIGAGETLDLADRFERLHAERQLLPGMRVLLDLRSAILLHSNFELIGTCLRWRLHHRRWLRRTAMVVGGEPDHRRAGQYSRLAALLGMTVAPFRTTEEALAWLDLA